MNPLRRQACAEGTRLHRPPMGTSLHRWSLLLLKVAIWPCPLLWSLARACCLRSCVLRLCAAVRFAVRSAVCSVACCVVLSAVVCDVPAACGKARRFAWSETCYVALNVRDMPPSQRACQDGEGTRLRHRKPGRRRLTSKQRPRHVHRATRGRVGPHLRCQRRHHWRALSKTCT